MLYSTLLGSATGPGQSVVELAGLPAGVLAVPVAGLHRPGWSGLGGVGGALVGSAGKLSTGEQAVFAVPVTQAAVVVRADGRVQAGGHLAGHARPGLLESYLPAGVVGLPAMTEFSGVARLGIG